MTVGRKLWIRGTKHRGHKIISLLSLPEKSGREPVMMGYTTAGPFIVSASRAVTVR